MKLKSKALKGRWQLLKLPILFMCMLCMYAIWPMTSISISDGYKHLYVKPQSFYIEYTHSVAKSTIQEGFTFDASTQTFLLNWTSQSAFGAGLPTEHTSPIILEDGLYYYKHMNVPFSSIPLRVGTIADQMLVFENGKQIILSDYFPAGKLVMIKPTKHMRLVAFFQ